MTNKQPHARLRGPGHEKENIKREIVSPNSSSKQRHENQSNQSEIRRNQTKNAGYMAIETKPSVT